MERYVLGSPLSALESAGLLLLLFMQNVDPKAALVPTSVQIRCAVCNGAPFRLRV